MDEEFWNCSATIEIFDIEVEAPNMNSAEREAKRELMRILQRIRSSADLENYGDVYINCE